MDGATGEQGVSSLGARLRVEGLSKTFPGVKALLGVDLDIRPAEVHALVGPNGSGKSTLIKVMSGFESADPGASVWLEGRPVGVGQLAHRGKGATGMAFVHQDLGLVLELSALDNFALRTGFERSRFGRISQREQARMARRLLEPLGVELDLTKPLSRVTPVERTMVAVAIALHGWDPRTGILVLDEPTAALPYHEVQKLTQVVRRLRESGAGILYVSHRLDEIFDLADRVTVLRNGRRVVTSPVSALTKRALVHHMLGEDAGLDDVAPTENARRAETALEVAGISGSQVIDASFSVYKGEIVGVAGLIGSGSDELPRLLSDRGKHALTGDLRLAGSDWKPVHRSHQDRIALVPPDRGREGVVQSMTVLENLTISQVGRLSTGPWLSRRAERTFATRWIKDLGVVTKGLDNRIENLSGGNQQKILIGRTLSRSPDVLILCEPTAGVDVGARAAIYQLIRAHVSEGLGVIVNSSDTGDLTALCDRVLVFRDGRICADLPASELSEKRLVQVMEGTDRGSDDGEAHG